MYENLSIPFEKQYAELHAQSHYLKPHVRKTLMTPNQFIRESKRFETKRAMHLLRKKKRIIIMKQNIANAYVRKSHRSCT